ncbi:hypothetical protein LshimejAT787_1102310 [Lyophyllum shimeji]|uniref:Uncharacterized protein n=1 Tax=Lyophyllum shimeji TaxID=47721 RepID=A0A9P3PV37_LYOSH|nr:hypothetical protein LshimejAT787_1102310 [Lyophyllum shimeji]
MTTLDYSRRYRAGSGSELHNYMKSSRAGHLPHDGSRTLGSVFKAGENTVIRLPRKAIISSHCDPQLTLPLASFRADGERCHVLTSRSAKLKVISTLKVASISLRPPTCAYNETHLL